MLNFELFCRWCYRRPAAKGGGWSFEFLVLSVELRSPPLPRLRRVNKNGAEPRRRVENGKFPDLAD